MSDDTRSGWPANIDYGSLCRPPYPLLMIGLVLPGYCGGAFGRDGYGKKRIEAFGNDWIVVRWADEKGSLGFATFEDQEEMLRNVAEWASEKVPDE